MVKLVCLKTGPDLALEFDHLRRITELESIIALLRASYTHSIPASYRFAKLRQALSRTVQASDS